MSERTYDVELSPVGRQTGVAYLHDVDLDAGEVLAPSHRLVLRDEGGTLWDAEVAAVEEVRFGWKYRLRLLGERGPEVVDGPGTMAP
jgi:hypothetical protein